MSIRSDLTRRGLITGGAALASYQALAQSITPQLGGQLGNGTDGGLGGATVIPNPQVLFSSLLSANQMTVANPSANTYTHTFDANNFKPTPTVEYYVGPGGSDASNGTNWATRFLTLNKAIVTANTQTLGTIIRIRAQAYGAGHVVYKTSSGSGDWGGTGIVRDLIIEPCDSSGNLIATVLDTATVAGKTVSYADLSCQIVSIHDIAVPAYAATANANVFVSTYTVEDVNSFAYDLAFTNVFGRPMGLVNVNVTMVTDPSSPYLNDPIGATAFVATTWGRGAIYRDTTNKKIYVNLKDNRAPDANLVNLKGAANNQAARNLFLSPSANSRQCKLWARNLDLWGGRTFSALGDETNLRTCDVTLLDCGAGFGTVGGFVFQTAGNCRHQRSFVFDEFGGDAITYFMTNDTVGVANGLSLSLIEVDTVSQWIGNHSLFDNSTNGSSIHRGCKILRVNNTYDEVTNRIVHDILTAQSWNLGINYGKTRLTGGTSASGAVASGFPTDTGDTCTVFVDGGTFDATLPFSLEAYSGGKLFYQNVSTSIPFDTVGGTIKQYAYPITGGAHLGFSATGGGIPNGHFATNKFLNFRKAHIARGDIVCPKIILPNLYCTSAGGELGLGGAATWTASFEFGGASHPVTFGGAPSGVAADVGYIVSDGTNFTIPDGTVFWTRGFCSAPSGIVFFQDTTGTHAKQYATGGECFEASATTLTDRTTATGSFTGTDFFNMAGPIGIVSLTQTPSVMIVGDSISFGLNDISDATTDLGVIARGVGSFAGYCNCGIPSDKLSLFLSNPHTNRVALANAYANYLAIQLGVNDLSGGSSTSTLQTNEATIAALMPALRLVLATITPHTTSIDSFATSANQTPVASESNRVTANANRRASAFCMEIADLLETNAAGGTSPVRDGGRWLAPGYTTDGLHPSSVAACRAPAAQSAAYHQIIK